ncbi:hypothetical protein [Streptomyces sp. ST2-7A]|nr:hypothetical protein [Streptomyces sp. ST2-7A]
MMHQLTGPDRATGAIALPRGHLSADSTRSWFGDSAFFAKW